MTNPVTISNKPTAKTSSNFFNSNTALIAGAIAYSGYAIYRNDFLAPIKLGLQIINGSSMAVANSAEYLKGSFLNDVDVVLHSAVNNVGAACNSSLINVENAAYGVHQYTNALLDGGLDQIKKDVINTSITWTKEAANQALAASKEAAETLTDFATKNVNPILSSGIEYGFNTLNHLNNAAHGLVNLYENTAKYHSALLITGYALRDVASTVANGMKKLGNELLNEYVMPTETAIADYNLDLSGEVASVEIA